MMARGGWLGAGGAARPIGVKSSVTEDRSVADRSVKAAAAVDEQVTQYRGLGRSCG
jgi:hypothetical protein